MKYTQRLIQIDFIILMGKRELVALLNLSSWCLVMVDLVALPRGAMGLSAIYDCGIS